MIQDNDGIHTDYKTKDYFAQTQDFWHPRHTPPHTSWLNQAERLHQAFGSRYLKRQSWTSREESLCHIEAAWPEYNRLYAHPFERMWTNQKMRTWYANHAK